MQEVFQAWKFGGNNHFVTALFLLFLSFFFKDLTNRHFYNLAYKLHFLHTDLPMLQKQACSPKTNPPLSIYLECSPMQCVIKKINNAALKFLVYCQQPSSQDLCVNIAHIRSKTFCCVRKYIKFVKVSFQVLIKWYTLRS